MGIAFRTDAAVESWWDGIGELRDRRRKSPASAKGRRYSLEAHAAQWKCSVISADVKQERSMGMRVSETMTKESF